MKSSHWVATTLSLLVLEPVWEQQIGPVYQVEIATNKHYITRMITGARNGKYKKL